jgi:diaminopimelate decarboxylase
MLDQARVYREATDARLRWIDMGGGLAVRYRDETPPEVEDYIAAVAGPVREAGYEPWLEPGRWVVGPTAVLLTRALAVRPRGQRAFLVVDAGMTELVRPALYEAWHPIETASNGPARRTVDVVGPLCETGDVLGEGRPMPHLSRGDLLWVGVAGAYGRAMASQYNRRPFAPEVLVDGKKTTRIDTPPVR